MMIERRILEALDACRLASDDLHSADHPELAEAAALVREDAAVQEALARVQHFDTQIGQAMEDVDLPEGLAARVKARLAAVAAYTATPAIEAAPVDVAEPVSLPQPVDSTRRHWMLTAAAALAASVAVAVGVWQFGLNGEVELSREQLQTTSKELHSIAQDSSPWQTMSQAPADFPFPADALLAQPKGFKTFPGDRRAMAYDVSYGNLKATLIVYQGTAPTLDFVPPRDPFNTQGPCVGLWQRNGLLFALVVEGTPASYRRLLQSNQGTLG
jgi:hypothetical protein